MVTEERREAIQAHEDAVLERYGFLDLKSSEMHRALRKLSAEEQQKFWIEMCDYGQLRERLTAAVEAECAAAEARHKAAGERDRYIRALVDRGESLRDVAVLAGLSHTAVAKIARN